MVLECGHFELENLIKLMYRGYKDSPQMPLYAKLLVLLIQINVLDGLG